MSSSLSVGNRGETVTSPPSSTAKSQYHHFVPRFILRNFSHPFRPPVEPSKIPGKQRNSRRRKKNGHYPGDLMLNIISLAGNTANIVEAPVGKSLGMVDMYQDLRDDTNMNHLEEKFSKLESHAAMVIHKIRKAFESQHQDVWITRTERDTLRKFLFLMKYRGSGHHKRYHHRDPEGYTSDDRNRLLKYMREKGYKKPIDVWFDNINAMLALKMDPEMKWMKWLTENAYPDDAMWFIAHCQTMYLTLCTPSSPDDEFLLTENAYNIHEGPADCYVNPVTKETVLGPYTEFHKFAVISPKLMIVLRSFVLPVPEEDADEGIRMWRKNALEQIIAQHNNPLKAHSILENLPVRNPRNTYTKIVDGKLALLEGEDGSHRADHKFCFRFFPISTEYTDRINFIMLENAQCVSTIVFKSQQAASRTLKEYLTMPCELNSLPCFKMIAGSGDDEKLKLLKNLEKIVSDLGFKVESTYQIERLENHDPLVTLGQILQAEAPDQDKPVVFMQLYAKIGGVLVTLPKDMDQAAKMLKMRIEIDVWSKSLPESNREDIREKLGNLFCQLPPRRVWLYFKRVRFMLSTRKGKEQDQAIDVERLASESFEEKAEDIIVRASEMIRTGRVAHLIWFAATSDLFQRKIIGPAGSICEYGITDLEETARLFRDAARMSNNNQAHQIPFWTNEDELEVYIRCLVRENFDEIIGARAAVPSIQALKIVLFDLIYPCPGG